MPWPPERRAASHARMQQVAGAEGLTYAERTHWYNSIPAHEASLWADQQGNGEAFRRSVYRAYFADNLNIASPDVLARIADDVQLDSADLRTALADGRFSAEVQEQFQYAREVGITGVPAYVAGGYLMVGAQPIEMFRQLIETARSAPA